ncbi:MAG: hypothetical protein ACE5E1_07405 [Phycisphaerae bacterium]
MTARQGMRRVSAILAVAWAVAPCPSVRAEDEDASAENARPARLDEMKPTTLGIRFTPGMARAIGLKLSEQMKSRYELDDAQVVDIQGILSRQLMDFVQTNAETGRDMIEMMMETMIEHDGSFPKEAAMKFGKMAEPLLPALRGFFTRSSAEIGKRMTIKQRLKFTGDMAGVTAGLLIFEKRMNRWAEGKVGDDANPFFDPAENEGPNPAEAAAPEDPNEPPEHRKARKQVERWLKWQINIDRQWDDYVKSAAAYYDFDERQVTAAAAILKDCKQRAEAIKTPDWRNAILENRIARQLIWRIDSKFGQGPWMYHWERAYKKMMKPLEDLEVELKRRIEQLPTSKQRAAAQEAARKALAEKGVKRVPAF